MLSDLIKWLRQAAVKYDSAKSNLRLDLSTDYVFPRDLSVKANYETVFQEFCHFFKDVLFDWKTDCYQEFGKGATESFCLQSNLEWFDIYKNIFRWPLIGRARKTISQVENIRSDMSFMCLRVSKEGLLSVTSVGVIQYFDISTLMKTPYEKPINEVDRRLSRTYTYNENEYWEVVHYGDGILKLNDKRKKIRTDIRDVKCWSLVLENIYYICDRFKLFRLCNKGDNNENIFMATWYGTDSIYSISVYNEEIFLLTTTYKILKYSSMQILQITQLNIHNQALTSPSIKRYFFGRSVFLNSTWDNLDVYYNREMSNHVFPLITTFLYHGNILILGTGTGEVFFYDCQDDSMFHNIRLDNCIEYHTFLKEGKGLLKIKALEVVECVDEVKLFVATENGLYAIQYKYLST